MGWSRMLKILVVPVATLTMVMTLAPPAMAYDDVSNRIVKEIVNPGSAMYEAGSVTRYISLPYSVSTTNVIVSQTPPPDDHPNPENWPGYKCHEEHIVTFDTSAIRQFHPRFPEGTIPWMKFVRADTTEFRFDGPQFISEGDTLRYIDQATTYDSKEPCINTGPDDELEYIPVLNLEALYYTTPVTVVGFEDVNNPGIFTFTATGQNPVLHDEEVNFRFGPDQAVEPVPGNEAHQVTVTAAALNATNAFTVEAFDAKGISMVKPHVTIPGIEAKVQVVGGAQSVVANQPFDVTVTVTPRYRNIYDYTSVKPANSDWPIILGDTFEIVDEAGAKQLLPGGGLTLKNGQTASATFTVKANANGAIPEPASWGGVADLVNDFDPLKSSSRNLNVHVVLLGDPDGELQGLTGSWARADGEGATVQQGSEADLHLAITNRTGEPVHGVQVTEYSVEQWLDDTTGQKGNAKLTSSSESLVLTVLDGSGPSSTGIFNFSLEGLQPGPVNLTATVTGIKAGGEVVTAVIRQGWEIEESLTLVVNSVGDLPAEDPAKGCDTGATIDDDYPECTLRAAIEVANARGGGDITFNIAAAPIITLTEALPDVGDAVTIDGSSQPGGSVEIVGTGVVEGGPDTWGLRLAGQDIVVNGLAIHNALSAVMVASGSAELDEMLLGLNTAGHIQSDTASGLDVLAGVESVSFTNSAVGTVWSSVISAAPITVENNELGFDAAGAATGQQVAVALFDGATGSEITDNRIFGTTVGVLLLEEGAGSTTIARNEIGLDGDDPRDNSGIAVSVQGAPGVTITDNQLGSADGPAAVLISGSRQTDNDDPYKKMTIYDPGNRQPVERPTTGGGGLVEGNTIVGGENPAAVWLWADASTTEVRNNTISTASEHTVLVYGGGNNTVTDNTIGSETDPNTRGITIKDSANVLVRDNTVHISSLYNGIDITGAETPKIENNTVHLYSGNSGIRVSANMTGQAAVTGNTVKLHKPSNGIAVGAAETARATVSNNTIDLLYEDTGNSAGIIAGVWMSTTGGGSATVSGNTVSGAGAGTGLLLQGDYIRATGNSVVETSVGIHASGQQNVEVNKNFVGLKSPFDTPLGVTDAGIFIGNGSVVRASDNIVAGSDGVGIGVDDTARAELRGNRLWNNAVQAIANNTGPDAPKITAAIAEGGTDANVQTTLVVTDIPAQEFGRLEVFANDTCNAPGGQAKNVTDETRTIAAGENVRAVKITGDYDHFTVTFTSSDGDTSELSSCMSRMEYPDTNGNGVPVPLDAALGVANDSTKAVVVTEEEELLLASIEPADPANGTSNGAFKNVAIDGGTTPSAPGGLTLPYGVISFDIAGLELGASTTVTIAPYFERDSHAGQSYWKYGPPSPGEAPQWYEFSFDQETGTGAVLETRNVGSLGERPAYVLYLTDGERGDSDGVADGTITDPGGPASRMPKPQDPGSSGGPGSPGDGAAPGDETDPSDGFPQADPCVTKPFGDVGVASSFCGEIAWMRDSGITNGYDDGTFRPDRAMSRQAMAAFLFRLTHDGADAPACTSAPFRDVGVASSFCGEIAWMRDSGITNGYDDGTFRPDRAMSRQAMAAFLYRTGTGKAEAPAATRKQFTDVAAGHQFSGEIAWMRDSGITNGYDDGTFRPDRVMSRQAMAAFLYRLTAG